MAFGPRVSVYPGPLVPAFILWPLEGCVVPPLPLAGREAERPQQGIADLERWQRMKETGITLTLKDLGLLCITQKLRQCVLLYMNCLPLFLAQALGALAPKQAMT